MIDREQLISKFDELITEVKQLREEMDRRIREIDETANNSELISIQSEIEAPVGYYRILGTAKSLFLSISATHHYEDIKEYCETAANPRRLQGILEATKRDFVNGLLVHPKIIAAAESFENLLEQANYLLEQNYKDAACVLAGGVLEGTLRSMLANKYPSIEFNPKDGIKKFNRLLHQALAYKKDTFGLIDAYADLRNFAAHGEYTKYNKTRVEQFISFAKDFIDNCFAVEFSPM